MMYIYYMGSRKSFIVSKALCKIFFFLRHPVSVDINLLN